MNLTRISITFACGLLSVFCIPAGAAEDVAVGLRTNGATVVQAPATAQSLAAGRAALEDGLYELAEKELRVYLLSCVSGTAMPVETGDVVIMLLQAIHAQGHPADLLKALDAYGQLATKADLLAPGYWRAVALYESGTIDKALVILSGIEKTADNSRYARQVQRLLAWCLLKTGRVEEAIAAFGKYNDGDTPGSAESGERIEWAKALDAAGQVDAATGIFERLVSVTNAVRVAGESSYWLGQIRLRQARPSDAVALLSSVTTNSAVREDLRSGAWYGLAAAHQSSNNLALAVEALTNGIAQAQDFTVRRRGERALGLLLLDMKRYAEAIPILKQFVASQPDAPEAGPTQLRLTSSFLDRGAWEEAVRESQRYVETFTNRQGLAQALECQGWALAGLARHAEAANVFLKAYAMDTNPVVCARCLMKAGDSYFANEQYKLALESYARLRLEFSASDLVPHARFQWAESSARANAPDLAEEEFLALAHDRPGTMLAEEALLRAAELRQAGRRMDEAVTLYDQIANVYSNGLWLDKTLLGRGFANYQMYKFQKALSDFQTVATAFPTNSTTEEASYWATMSMYWMGRDEESVAAGRAFLIRYPDSKWVSTLMFWLGKHEYNRQSYADAENLFVRFADKMPSDPKVPDALLWASRAAALRGEYLRANEIVSRLVKEYPGARPVAEARSVQGDALVNLAKFSEAILVFEDLITRYPDSDFMPQVWLRKGDAQFMLGSEAAVRYTEALQSYRVVSGNSRAPFDLVLQAEYKIGRCCEKLGRADEAIEQYYAKVVVRFLQEREKGTRVDEAAKLWFIKASFNAADLMESRKEWRQVVTILERVVAAGVADVSETRDRIKRIRAEHWWLFY